MVSFINRLMNQPFASRTRGPQMPQALLDTQRNQRNAHLDESGKPKLTRLSDGRDQDLGWTGASMLPPRSQGAVLSQMRARPDAGNAVILPDNATIATLKFAYGSHKSMEAWVTERPPNGKLVLNMAISPSSHAGSTREQKTENYLKFGKTNIYNMEVLYPNGTSDRIRFDVDGNLDPKRGYEAASSQGATLGPDFEIDLDKWKGQDVKIRGWADGSAGVAGYQERRETILHL